MAEPLKNHFGTDVPSTIAAMVSAVFTGFPAREFIRDALQGYEALELMPRGRHIAGVLRNHLPAHVPDAIAILVASAEQPVTRRTGSGMDGFLFMPHLFFIGQFGLDHFDASMQAQHALTKRFSAEFSIRPFLLQHPARTLARLAQWAHDPDEHVRRLVSEGTRPRLPWAPRLPMFQANPRPVLDLLEHLKDDPSLYVRRSVANNLNDIGKDNPQLLMETARRWLANASAEREWIVRHALRWAVKQGDSAALDVLGFGAKAKVAIDEATLAPDPVPLGGSVALAFVVRSTASRAQELLVDLQVHFVKASGGTSAKVFKLKSLVLPGHGAVRLRRKLSLADLTTRRHYPGRHKVDALVNGQVMPLGEFTVTG